MFSFSLLPPKFNKNQVSISSCNKCDICNNHLISDNRYKCKVTDRVYSVTGSLSCNNPNVDFIYFL